MTSAGASGHKVGALGSVVDHVSRTVTIPIMVIKPGNAARTKDGTQLINRILVPLDGSDLSKLALPVAEELAIKLKVPITPFQMAPTVYPPDGEAAPFVDYEPLAEDKAKQISAEMTVVEKELHEKGLNVSWNMTSGSDAADEIISLSEKTEGGLVVMSSHGRSGLSHLALRQRRRKGTASRKDPLLLVHASGGG